MSRRAWSLTAVQLLLPALLLGGEPAFPGPHWERREPAALGLDPPALREFSDALGGRGCVVKDGYVVHAWGDQAERSDWYSSVKPLFSTLLFFAIEEGKLSSVDQPVVDFGWPLAGKDRAITFRHLADMTSGYARPEPPGAAWAYNDFAIQLYQKTLFDRVFHAEPASVVVAPGRLGPLEFEDGLEFTRRRRLHASVRDFARIAWFWANRGRWGGRQLLPASYFDRYMKPDVPVDLPRTAMADTADLLGIGTFGGGSDHFSADGPGIYGFNWWFNAEVPGHKGLRTWPDAPTDTVMSLGFGGNNSVLIPSQGLIVASAQGDWGSLRAGRPDAPMNLRLGLLSHAFTPRTSKGLQASPGRPH